MIVIHLATELLGMSRSKIGRALGRDHSTIVHSLEAVAAPDGDRRRLRTPHRNSGRQIDGRAGDMRVMTMLLQDLSGDEIAALLRLTAQFKKRFGTVATHLLAVARENEIDEAVARLSITCECLLLAAYMHSGTHEVFLDAARSAIETAARNRPRPNVGVQ